MPLALLIAGIVFAVLTANSHRPLYRPGSVALGSFFAGWLCSELPWHKIALHAATAGTLVALGALEHWHGWLGLGLTVASTLGMTHHIGLAARVPTILESSLSAGLGPDYQGEVDDELRERFTRSATPWRLARVLPIRRRDVTKHANIEYHSVGRKKLHLDVYTAKGQRADAKRPVLLYVHGGAWVIGNKRQQGLMTVNQMASRGWVCVTINYRLSPRATFPDHLLDVKRAIKWIRENGEAYGADPDFIIVAGGSAGAHLVSLASLTANDLEYQREFGDVDTTVQGCIAYYGVYDFTNSEGHFRHRAFKTLMERVVMKRRMARALEEFEKASPMYRVGEHAPPFFLIHGDRDTLAPVAGARSFAARLRERSSAPVVYAELPGAQHAFEIFPSTRSAHTIDAVERFCAYVYSRHRARRSAEETA